MKLSERMLRSIGDTTGNVVGWADEVSRLERIKEAAEKAISWMEESGPGVDELIDALKAEED